MVWLSWFPSINGPFPQCRRQTAGFLVRRTIVRLRTTPCFPKPCEKLHISELETRSTNKYINGWALVHNLCI
jgi:hypothetical protein